LSAIQLGANLDVKITEKWFAGTNLFFVGERKDRFMRVDLLVPVEQVRKADSYFDANVHIGYNFSDRLSFFLRGNNLANQNYEKWLDYPVQPIQVMVGGNYKFDF
jgi:outer membrane receptor protein involved in Fe transport